MSFGVFPFGQPNSVRPARLVADADAVVVGVYPSAWHITWRAPPGLGKEGTAGGVAALAVDVEPTVFWDGNSDDFAARLARWKSAVGFVDGKHGTISTTSPRTNGSSGEKVVRHYLSPLGISGERVTFTDVYPVFLVKSSKGARREQGDAIREEYDAIATALGMPKCTLPSRIPSTRLPAVAADTFGARLIDDIAQAAAPLVITLGEEVWQTFLELRALEARPPREQFTELYGDGYGATGTINVRGRPARWLPLVHPGLLKGAGDLSGTVDPRRRTTAGWNTLHSRWALRVRSS